MNTRYAHVKDSFLCSLTRCSECTLCLKNIRDIFDCNLKTNYYQILIIFGTNIPDYLTSNDALSFPPYQTFVSALPGGITISKISLFIQYDMIA